MCCMYGGEKQISFEIVYQNFLHYILLEGGLENFKYIDLKFKFQRVLERYISKSEKRESFNCRKYK